MLGPVASAERVYSAGVGADPIPPAGLIGNAQCIQNGEVWPLPVIDRTFAMGWDSRCYELTRPTTDDAPFIFDLRDCNTQVRMARVLELMYQGDGSAAATQFLDYYPTAIVSVAPNTTGPIPGTLIATIQGRTIVLISGTTNPLQWALQGFSGAAGLVNFGQYSTLLAWRIASDAIQNRIMDATLDPEGPISLIGHSYGGAIACILAARYRLHNPFRYIQLLTFGCPKPGDSRLADILSTVQQTHFVNDDDPVTYLPPSGPDLGLLAALIPGNLIARWNSYARPANRIGLDASGNRRDNPDPDDVYSLLFRIVNELVSGETPAAINSHMMHEYRRRLRCPDAPPPAPAPTAPLLFWIRREELTGLVGDNIDEWEEVSGNERHLTYSGSGTQPIITGQYGPEGAILFGSQQLAMPEPLFPGTDISVYMVVGKSSLTTPVGPFFGFWNGHPFNYYPGAGHTGSAITLRSPSASILLSAPMGEDEWHLLSMRMTETTLIADFDGSNIFAGTKSALIVAQFGSWGTAGTLLATGSAMIGECLLFGGVVSDDQHAELTYYLLEKFGLPTP